MHRVWIPIVCVLFIVGSAQAWPSGGDRSMTPRLVRDDDRGERTRVRGEIIRTGRDFIVVRSDQGRDVAIDVSRLSRDRARDYRIGDQVVVLGTVTGDRQLVAEDITARDGNDDRRGDGRDRVHGEVLKIERDRMWIKADRGQQVEVDLTRLGNDALRSLRRGDEVIVTGEAIGDRDKPSQFVAYRISIEGGSLASPRYR